MDEEDGRPGSVALQFGHVDALTDVRAAFLRPAQPAPTSSRIARFRHNHLALFCSRRKRNIVARMGRLCLREMDLFPEQFFARTCTIEEKHNENVPGK